MYNKILLIAATLLIAGCATSNNQNYTKKSQQQERPTQAVKSEPPKKSTSSSASSKPIIYLPTPKFSTSLGVSKVASECSMLNELENSILESAKDYDMNIVKLASKAISESDITMEIKYTSLTSHKWRLFAIRPSSEAMLNIVIKQGNKILNQTNKSIGSSVAFGACDRLEKIAVAGGRFVAKWASRLGY